jgi:hypothetical protein
VEDVTSFRPRSFLAFTGDYKQAFSRRKLEELDRLFDARIFGPLFGKSWVISGLISVKEAAARRALPRRSGKRRWPREARSKSPNAGTVP